MPAPERRTRADMIAAAAIFVVVVVTIALIWQHSQAHGTVSRPAQRPAPAVAAATAVPDTLRELWHAGNDAVSKPVALAAAAVTADGGTVIGRVPGTGEELWRYQRNLPLCGIDSSWSMIVTVYRDRRGCSQATELDAATGERVTARNSDADRAVYLHSVDSYLLSQGPTRLEVWRSDLVRTLEYGRVDAPVNPKSQPRSGCALLGSALNSIGSRVVVLEKCPGDSDARITVLNPAPKDAQKPEEFTSTVLSGTSPGGAAPRLLAASAERIAVFLPNPGRIGLYTMDAKPIAEFPVAGPVSPNARVDRAGYNFMFWTGEATTALNPTTLEPLWTFPGTCGPGALMVGRMLIPTDTGYAVLDAATGIETRRIPLSRNNYRGLITTTPLGDTILEQRGGDLYAVGK